MDSSDSLDGKTSGETENRELLDSIDLAIGAMQKKLSSVDGAKVSLTDLVRLLQLRKELEADRPRRVVARWIDECESSIEK